MGFTLFKRFLLLWPVKIFPMGWGHQEIYVLYLWFSPGTLPIVVILPSLLFIVQAWPKLSQFKPALLKTCWVLLPYSVRGLTFPESSNQLSLFEDNVFQCHWIQSKSLINEFFLQRVLTLTGALRNWDICTKDSSYYCLYPFFNAESDPLT